MTQPWVERRAGGRHRPVGEAGQIPFHRHESVPLGRALRSSNILRAAPSYAKVRRLLELVQAHGIAVARQCEALARVHRLI